MQPIQKTVKCEKSNIPHFTDLCYTVSKIRFSERNDAMNIPELSTALANTQLASKVGIAVLDKALESSQTTGESLINMMDRSMELSVNPHIGGNIDMLV